MSPKNQEETIQNLIAFRERGDRVAGNKLVEGLDKLVHAVVHKFAGPSVSRADKEELYQAGMVGVTKAINAYDVKSKASLSTYAYYKILREITREMNEGFHLIAIPYSNITDLKAYIAKSDEYLSISNTTMTHKEYVMSELNMKEHKFWRLHGALKLSTVRSFETPLSNDEEALTLGDQLSVETIDNGYGMERVGTNPEQMFIEDEIASELGDIMAQLDAPQRDLILSRLAPSHRRRKLTKSEQGLLAPVQEKLRGLLG